MPPPRLSRHLRPCQFSWSALRVRRASFTLHAKFSTAGDDNPKSVDSHVAEKSQTVDFESPVASQNPPRNDSINVKEGRDGTHTAAKEQTAHVSQHRHGAVDIEISGTTPFDGSENDRRHLRRSQGGETARHEQRASGGNIQQNAEKEAIERQLSQLLERAKILQDALDGRNRPRTHASDFKTENSTSSSNVEPPHSRRIRSTNYLNDGRQRASPSGSTTRQHSGQSGIEPAQILKSATSYYSKSTKNLIKLATELEQDTPLLAAPLVTSIQKRLVTIAEDAVREDDLHIRRLLGHYKKSNPQFNNLVAHLRPASKASPDRLASLDKEYRRSAAAFVDAANMAHDMNSPTTSTISTMMGNRLLTIAKDAEAEDDRRMRHTLSRYKNYASGHSSGNEPASSQTQPSPQEEFLVPPAIRPEMLLHSSSPFIHLTNRWQQDSKPTGDAVKQGDRSTNKNTSNMVKESDRHAPLKEIHTQSALRTSDRSGDLPSNPSDQTASKSKQSSSAKTSASKAPQSRLDTSEQSLLEELFPEVTKAPKPRPVEKREQYPKLSLPESAPLIRREFVDPPKSLKEKVIESFQSSGEAITVLQLEHCSTELTEADFRRLIPKGKHIESWNRDGEFYKIIPGRDPLSLERKPFYYLLFKSPQSAQAYQNNATRLHQLAALHHSSSLFSAIPPPKGFLEDGEDVGAITSSYVLKPTEHAMTLRTLMQPYHPALRALLDQGGYKPIVPEVDDKGNRIYKVLMSIEGYEPSPSDLFKIFSRDAYKRGMTLTLRNESSSSVHRLRDIINLKTRMQPISTTNPRAYGHWELSDPSSDAPKSRLQFDDPGIDYLMRTDPDEDGDNAKHVNQMVMNRVYNRWMIEFDDEAEARRFAVAWHRRVLPALSKGDRTWKDYEEVKTCNCEYLW